VGDSLKFRASGSDLPQITEVLEQSHTAGKGLLQGTVTIGPIWPVERPEGNPPIPPEVYEARKILVYDSNRTELIEQVDIVPHGDYGSYAVELAPGSYLVDINHLGIDSSGDVPVEIDIRSGQTVELDIDIDTGIR